MSPALAPHTVRVTLAGAADDIIRLTVFLEAVCSRRDPAEAMTRLHLMGILIKDVRNTRGRSTSHVTMMVELLSAAPPPEGSTLS